MLLILTMSILPGSRYTLSASSESDRTGHTEDEMVVIADVLRVRARPTTEADIIGRLPEGTGVTPLERAVTTDADRSGQSQWLRIALPDGNSGWIHGDYVRLNRSFPADSIRHVFFYAANEGAIAVWDEWEAESTAQQIALDFVDSFRNGQGRLAATFKLHGPLDYYEIENGHLNRLLNANIRPVLLNHSGQTVGTVRLIETHIHEDLPPFSGFRAEMLPANQETIDPSEICAGIYPPPSQETNGINFEYRPIENSEQIHRLFQIAFERARRVDLDLAKFTHRDCGQIDVSGRILFNCTGSYENWNRENESEAISFLLERKDQPEAQWRLLDLSFIDLTGGSTGLVGIKCATDMDQNNIPELWMRQSGYCGETIIKRVHLLKHIVYEPPAGRW
ncbi:MAG: SH3 domain-containing protein [Leptospiraceae bacterium]|nr:SH3 domain-containing protein [Leptospiraceae bacterium]MCB1315020.1 SH3 domain-containing protein [Leptospiraceae bacterium]